MKILKYPNGTTLWDGENLYHKNGKIAWKNGMAFYSNEQIAYSGNKGFHPNGEVAWDGFRAFDLDGSSLSNFGVALKLSSLIDITCDKGSITGIIDRNTRILLKQIKK